MFGLPHALTAHDEAANTFEKNLALMSSRGDAPMLLPVPGEEDEIKRLRALFHKDAHARSLVEKLSPKHESHAPLTLFQKSLVQLADRLNNDVGANLPARAGEIIHEHEAALHVHESITRFLEDK